MKYLLLIFIITLPLCFVPHSNAQNINPRSVDVNALSESQINKIIDEINKRGLSDEEAIAMARMRGATPYQINILKNRIQEARNRMSSSNSGGSNYTDNNITNSNNNDSELSAKGIFAVKDSNQTFGSSLFNTQKLTFEPSLNIPTPKNYNLGIGDEVIITIWGASQATYQLKVSSDGHINIPDIGPVNVYGQSFELVTNKIKNQLTRIYQGMKGDQPNTFAEVNLGALRSIKINVVGEANAPGTYTVPATASVYNVLYLSGGPSSNGSFRNIQVLRDGKRIKTIDVYDFFLDGKTIDNINLKENDIIYIPTYQNMVKFEGAFKRTGYFETLDQTTLAEVIQLAGGFKNNAFEKNLTVIRQTDSELQYRDVTKAEFESFVLKNGDIVSSGKLLERYENRVTISGSVFRPGSYALAEGMLLSDLITKAEGVTPEVYTNRAVITRLNADQSFSNIAFDLADVLEGKWDTQLQREDVVTIRNVQEMKEEEYITVEGFVNHPGRQPFASDLTLADVIFLAQGFKNNADINEIEISRRIGHEEGAEYTNQLTHIYSFNIDRNLKLTEKDKAFKIAPYDVISIRKAPGVREGGSIVISGEVMKTGSYSLNDRKERISDIITRSGGLTPLAYAKGAMLEREVKLTDQEKRQREMMLERDSLLKSSMIMDDELAKFEKVGIRLDKILNNPGGPDDILLAAGDKIYIPRQMETVKVSGNVMNPISTTFKSGKRAKYFIKQAGGFGARPKRASVYVVSANGISKTTNNYILFNRYPKIEPGSEIIVPQRPETQMGVGQWVAFGSAITGLAISIASLASILN